MQFNLNQSIGILSNTPEVLDKLLYNLSDEWIFNNEGGESWNPFDVVGQLIHGEKTDWPARLEIILSYEGNKTFTPFDRFAQFEESRGKSLPQLLETFKTLRAANLELLKSKNITTDELSKKGIHPVFGEVTLEQLLSTWVAHDLGHLAQIARVMAKQYSEAVGPWIQYLPILTR